MISRLIRCVVALLVCSLPPHLVDSLPPLAPLSTPYIAAMLAPALAQPNSVKLTPVSSVPPPQSQLPATSVLPTLPALSDDAHKNILSIFSQNSEAAAAIPAYEDFDDYVPYRSDIVDQFSWSLLKQVLYEDQGNVIISPFSVKLSLALLSEAAGNDSQTQRELISTLTDIKRPENLRGFYKKTLVVLKKPSPYYTLNMDTKLYTDVAVEPQQRFAAVASGHYDTDIERLLFADARQSAAVINAWCANVTHGRLQQLVTEEAVQNNMLLLANVLYFNGLWRRPFNQTFPGAFFHTPSAQVPVQYMEQTDYFYYHDDVELDAKILRLPYKGKKFAMFVLLPKQLGHIERLTQQLANDQLKRMQWAMEEAKVKVTMPKFTFDYNKNLKATLQQLGIVDIFTNHASLPGLARGAAVTGLLKVSNVYQKSGIDVNERGTEAYASTVVEIDNKFGGTPLIQEFNVNQPFLFLIEEEATGNIIFAGRVALPHAASAASH